jgi:hypothetical protein
VAKIGAMEMKTTAKPASRWRASCRSTMAETTPWRSKCQYSATLRAPGLPSQDRAAAPRIRRASLPLVRASVYFRNTQ